MASVNVKLYDPSPEGMDIRTNLQLATSFYHSRHTHPLYTCNYDHGRDQEYDRNAGAVKLYIKNSTGKYVPYDISGNKNHEYHVIAYGNKYFKNHLKYEPGNPKRSSYGHSERILMRDILDDLISADQADKNSSPEVERPSDKCCSTISGVARTYEILKNLTNNTEIYKSYLESKGVIVKMWSERPPCNQEPDEGVGGTCEEFIEKIFPKGSQFGFIVRDYTRIDNQYGAPKVKKAFTDFEDAYNAYSKRA